MHQSPPPPPPPSQPNQVQGISQRVVEDSTFNHDNIDHDQTWLNGSTHVDLAVPSHTQDHWRNNRTHKERDTQDGLPPRRSSFPRQDNEGRFNRFSGPRVPFGRGRGAPFRPYGESQKNGQYGQPLQRDISRKPPLPYQSLPRGRMGGNHTILQNTKVSAPPVTKTWDVGHNRQSSYHSRGNTHSGFLPHIPEIYPSPDVLVSLSDSNVPGRFQHELSNLNFFPEIHLLKPYSPPSTHSPQHLWTCVPLKHTRQNANRVLQSSSRPSEDSLLSILTDKTKLVRICECRNDLHCDNWPDLYFFEDQFIASSNLVTVFVDSYLLVLAIATSVSVTSVDGVVNIDTFPGNQSPEMEGTEMNDTVTSGNPKGDQKIVARMYIVLSPSEPWRLVRDIYAGEEWSHEPGESDDGSAGVKITPLYTDGVTCLLIQDLKQPGICSLKKILDPTKQWQTLNSCFMSVSFATNMVILYCVNPQWSGPQEKSTLSVFVAYLCGGLLVVLEVPLLTDTQSKECSIVFSVPTGLSAHTEITPIYARGFPEPLLLSSSLGDLETTGRVQVWRLYLLNYLFESRSALNGPNKKRCINFSPTPRVIRQIMVPAVSICHIHNLTLDLPLFTLPGIVYPKDCTWHVTPLPSELDLEDQLLVSPPQLSASSIEDSLLLWRYRGTNTSPYGNLLQTVITGKHLNLVETFDSPGFASKKDVDVDEHQTTKYGEGSNREEIVCASFIRWGPMKDCAFVILQYPAKKLVRLCATNSSTHCDEWASLYEFRDNEVPLSESRFFPFLHYPDGSRCVTGEETEPDAYVLVVHVESQKGGVFHISSPKEQWRFTREVDVTREPEFFDPDAHVSVLYHHPKAPNSPVSTCTFFVVTSQKNGCVVKVVPEPGACTITIANPTAWSPAKQPALPPLALYVQTTKEYSPRSWPMETFMCWMEEERVDNRTTVSLVVAFIQCADEEWMITSKRKLPGVKSIEPYSISAMYLKYYDEPLLCIWDRINSTLDIMRLNLPESLAGNHSARFLMRFNLDCMSTFHSCDLSQYTLLDNTADLPLQWFRSLVPKTCSESRQKCFRGFSLPMEVIHRKRGIRCNLSATARRRYNNIHDDSKNKSSARSK